MAIIVSTMRVFSKRRAFSLRKPSYSRTSADPTSSVTTDHCSVSSLKCGDGRVKSSKAPCRSSLCLNGNHTTSGKMTSCTVLMDTREAR